MPEKKVVIYGPVLFPAGDAGAHRLMGIAKMFEKAGFQVLVIGISNKISNEKIYKINNSKDIYYTTIVSKSANLRSKLRYVSGGLDYVKTIKKWGYSNPEVVLSYGGYVLGNYLAFPILKNNSKVIVDIVEWYSSLQRKSLGLIKYYNNQLAIKSYYKRFKNVIVISDYLNNYYKDALVLPPVVDVHEYPVNNKIGEEKIKIIYAGKNEGKDELGNFIEAFTLLDNSIREKFEINFYGVSKVNLLSNLNFESKELILSKPKLFNFNERLEHKEIRKEISISNFTLLFRSNERYALAGFPSKVPESLACSTPLFCNYTSDLNKYLTDGMDSTISHSNTSKDIAKRLKDISELTKEDLVNLKINARNTAETKFSLEKWQNRFESFLNSLN